jgi:hypothetical protein
VISVAVKVVAIIAREVTQVLVVTNLKKEIKKVKMMMTMTMKKKKI